ncbi:MAG TPA: acetyl-CoA carboxylase carboxyl transferase subunit beta, partial [Caulobacteraceae bacterium]|nr:acetyl-CoA carboxylase carboxyl transferase subunit beta [Caulobacteraceae bacterium]
MAKPPRDQPPKGDPPAADPPAETPKAAGGQGQGWISRIAPGVRRLVTPKRDVPDNLWVKCPGTDEMVYRPELEAALWVTPSGHHMRIGPKLRFAYTFDGGRYEIIASPRAAEDPLHFSDDRPYRDRLSSARKATGADDAMAIAHGAIDGVPAVVVVQDFAFMAGS